jgi:hypothetical protein
MRSIPQHVEGEHEHAGDDARDVAGDTGGGGVVDLAGEEEEPHRMSSMDLNSMRASSSWATLACSFLGLDLQSRAQWPVLPHFRH